MKQISLFLGLIYIVLNASAAYAAEVRNLRTGQEGKRAFALFDLAGKLGEKEADVSVVIEINGERYSAGKLSLSGDFGKNVKVGMGRKVYWDLLKDMPAGFEGEIGWDVEAASTEAFVAALKAEEKRKAKELDEQRRLALLKKTQEQKAEQERIAAEKIEQERISNLKANTEHQTKVNDGNVETEQKQMGTNEGPFFITDSTINDKSTRLVWRRDAGKPMLWRQVQLFVDKMNNNKFAGYDDWRLPTIAELKTLVAYAKDKGWGDREGHLISDYLNMIGFKNVKPEYSPSSEFFLGPFNTILDAVQMWDGRIDSVPINRSMSLEDTSLCVLLVRGNKGL